MSIFKTLVVLPFTPILVEKHDDLKSIRLKTPENEEIICCYVDDVELEDILKEGYVIVKSTDLLSNWLDDNLKNG